MWVSKRQLVFQCGKQRILRASQQAKNLPYMHSKDTSNDHTFDSWISCTSMFAPCRTIAIIFVALSMFASGCALTVPILPLHDYQPFPVSEQENRAIRTPLVHFKELPDINTHCAQLLGPPPPRLRYFGCARWTAGLDICEVYLPSNPSNHIKGHELRHCFDGNFH